MNGMNTNKVVSGVVSNVMRTGGAVGGMMLAPHIPIEDEKVKGAVMLLGGAILEGVMPKQFKPVAEGISVAGGLQLAAAVIDMPAVASGGSNMGTLDRYQVKMVERTAAGDQRAMMSGTTGRNIRMVKKTSMAGLQSRSMV